jgi:hypothetical protein
MVTNGWSIYTQTRPVPLLLLYNMCIILFVLMTRKNFQTGRLRIKTGGSHLNEQCYEKSVRVRPSGT